MKKCILTIVSVFVLVIAGCSSDASGDTEATEPKSENLATAVMDFQMKVIETINKEDANIYTFDKNPTKETQQIAQKEAAAVADKIAQIQVSSSLQSEEERVQQILTHLEKAYQAKAQALQEGKPAQVDTEFPAYNEQMDKASSILNNLLEENDLISTPLRGELQ